MRVIDPGHQYALAHLDGNLEELLTFVKREGAGYPGNVGSYPGTNIQEVLRALIAYLKYRHLQMPSRAFNYAIEDLRHALKKMEIHGAQLCGRAWPVFANTIELMPTCALCGYIGCQGECRPVENADSSRSGFSSLSEEVEDDGA